MPTFLPDKPQSTDQLSISQGDLLNNFSILGAIAGNGNASSAGINTSIVNSGFNWIYLPNNGSIPPVGSAFPAGDVALYGNLNSLSGQNELYINKTTNIGLKQIPLSAGSLTAQGWSYLPSGIILQWGTGNATSNTTPVTFPIAFSTVCFAVICTGTSGVGADALVKATNKNTTGFTPYASFQLTLAPQTNIAFSYLAIGY